LTSEIAELITAEQGKPLASATREVGSAASRLAYFANLEVPAEVLQDDDDAHVEIVRRPLGVVAAITPWNFPIGLALWKIAPALRAGNAVVLKPSPFTPLSALKLGEVLRDVLPPGVVNVVSGGDELGALISGHPVPRKVTFTGSIGTGQKVNAAAAPDLKRVTLELGGNDPAIVLDDADPAAIAHDLFWSAFINNGQACAAVKRVYAPTSLYRALVDALAAIASEVPVGDPRRSGTLLGPLSTKVQLERVASLVGDAVDQGARIAAGGHRLERPGYFFAPTVLADLSDGVAIVDEEQFGPALPVVPYRDLDDALERANATRYGLGSSVWTSDPDRGETVARELDTGMTWINGHAVSPVSQPFGGVKWSGLGVENGIWGLHSFSDMHVVHRRRR